MTDLKNSADKQVKDFLAEAEENVEELISELGILADGFELGETQPDRINSIFRAAHSLKGLSGMFGYKTLSELSHHLETLLENLRLGRIDLNENILTVLFESAEMLSQLVRSVALPESSDYGNEIDSLAGRINACITGNSNSVSQSPLSELGLSERVINSLTEYEEHRLKYNLEHGKAIYSVHVSYDMNTFDQDLNRITEEIKSFGELISTLPGVGENVETHIDFDLLFSADQSTLVFTDMPGFTGAEVSCLNSTLAGSEQHRENASSTGAVNSSSPVVSCSDLNEAAGSPLTEAPVSSKSISGTVRVDISKLDELMSVVGELVQSHATISTIAAVMRSEGFSRLGVDLGKAAKDLERRVSELQKGVLDIRLVPVGQLYDKMARIVRRISREQGKKVELEFYGAETELDKLLVEELSDPLMHIIRNAIDHGIETPEQRLQKGKSERGLISISSSQKGDSVVIEIKDDGKGIDIEGIKQRALQRGLLKDVSNLADRDALEIIFLPGFSTADTVSEVSGRGVGMDVVRNNINAISGTVDVETFPGVGSRFTITLPITLAIIKVLKVSAADRIYAMPISSVRETLLLKKADIETIEQKKVFTLRNSTIPLVWLDRYLGHVKDAVIAGQEIFVVVVGSGEKRTGIVVDEFVGQQDVVIKSLGDAFKGFNGISGAADLGDLGTVLVLDAGAIINEARKNVS
jgi:two-component system, chemotaxis family, sensor kinase CheA